jgi:hypothetical protein
VQKIMASELPSLQDLPAPVSTRKLMRRFRVTLTQKILIMLGVLLFALIGTGIVLVGLLVFLPSEGQDAPIVSRLHFFHITDVNYNPLFDPREGPATRCQRANATQPTPN